MGTDADPGNTDVPTCRGCAARDRRIAQFRAHIAELEAPVSALSDRVKQLTDRFSAAARAAKRQAAPFSKGPPKADPKTPGRKRGDDYGTKAFRAAPEHVDEVHAAPLPDRCPHCGGTLVHESVDHQYQTEIPTAPIRRRFDIHVGRCACCRKAVRGRHRLQTSAATGCCASQLGPLAQAAVVQLNKDAGLSRGKIAKFFSALFGINLTRGGACQAMLRAPAAVSRTTTGSCAPSPPPRGSCPTRPAGGSAAAPTGSGASAIIARVTT